MKLTMFEKVLAWIVTGWAVVAAVQLLRKLGEVTLGSH